MLTKTFKESRICAYEFFQRVNPGGSYAKTAESAVQRILTSEFSGENNPSWWLQVRYGQNATTNASGIKEQLFGTPFLASMSFANVDRLVQGDPHIHDILPPPSAGEFPGLRESVNNAVLTRFLTKCRNEQRKLQGLVVLGELRKTIQLIRNPLKAFDNAIKQYVTAVRGKAKRLSPRLIPKMITEEYLSFTYGVTPLLHDIKGAYEACIRLRDFDERALVRAAVVQEKLISHSAGTGSYYSIPYHYETWRYAKEIAVIKGAVKFKSVGADPPLLKEVTGATLRDFVPAAWELIPYSFLVDYFVNVGDILNCLSFSQADLAWHSRSNISMYISKTVLSAARPETVFGQPVTAYSFNPCAAQWSTKTFSRDSQPLGLPHLVFKLPEGKQNVNIAALAAFRAL